MRTYLVGGAVRDLLLDIKPKDRDYVVVGATAQQMLDLGFQHIDADFPVFLHPETRDEYALARTERKAGQGHKGFSIEYDPTVTLEQDLLRRDLTINAMAMAEDGELIDPYGGERDLRDGILRAVSPAFAEDPLRVLRVARFAARYGFTIAPETIEMCRDIARREEFARLTSERLGLELMKALECPHPESFFRSLLEMRALHVHFPEIAALVGVPQPPEHHPEGDAFEHTMLVLQQAVRHSYGVPGDLVGPYRFAALVHDLGKATTPKEILPAHHRHEERGVPLVADLCNRLRLPTLVRQKGQVAARYHTHVHRIMAMSASGLARFANEINAPHSLENVALLSFIGACDQRGRLGREGVDYPEADFFEGVMRAVHAAKFRDRFAPEEIRGMSTERRQNEMARIRVDAVKAWLRERSSDASTEMDAGAAPAMR